MIMLHVRNLGEETLARRIYEEEKANCWPGLIKETMDKCKRLEIECVHSTGLDARKYRRLVTEELHRENEKIIKSQANNKTKFDRIF